MVFNSIEFLIFFPVVTTLYFVLPHRARWALLLAASCLFYMAFIPAYILILAATIVVDYFAGIWIENASGRSRKALLVVSLVSNLGFLFFFKYFNFFNTNLARVAAFFDWNYPIGSLGIILPIGLSFHTFQAMSYTIEVYRGHERAERHFGIYALYVMFYPQLVAGPIERPQNLIHQFREPHDFDDRRVIDGLKLMFWGLFKKVVIADRLAVAVDSVYNNPAGHHGLAFLLATVFFAFQIYCDFSGYSDIAIGSARVMGFTLMENFRRPYLAQTVSDFWRRWHISLSTWFKDYLYISLGGNRVPVPRWFFNLFLVFLVSGLWHGANWTFIAWGALHGFYLIFAIATEVPRERLWDLVGLNRVPALHRALRVATTFALVGFGWIFFRANSMTDALYIAGHTFTGAWDVVTRRGGSSLGIGVLFPDLQDLYLSLALIAWLFAVELAQERWGDIARKLARQPAPLRWAVYELGVLAVVFLGVFQAKQFIYFQF
jgi:D-alanyl-lipoteichoic acid acyltransferase DltB (MBOAT superfamily)